ncbi:MAG: hypothetical protein JW723_08200 [Bacteroidales bacterium]|nr:hypothetical protein [Bacteroidales bacterium]
MKTGNKILKAGIILAVLILTNSCLEYEITTQVHSDGSIERYFKVSGDQDMINEESSITLPADSTWEIKTWREPDDSSKNKPDSIYVYTARKTFKSYKEMNEELKNAPDIYNMVNMQVSLKRKFRWFYTFIKYTEIYQRHFPYNYLPLKDFLTEEELRYSLSDDKDYMFDPVKDKFEPVAEADTDIVFTGKDSARASELDKDIEKRFEEWQLRNINEDYCDALSKVLSKKNPEAYQLMLDRKSVFCDSLDLEGAPEDGDDQIEMLKIQKYVISRTSDFLGISENDILPSENPDIQSFFDRLAYMRLNEWYTYNHKTILPGKIIQTNSTRLEDGNSTWSFRLADFYNSDFEMTVESRLVNRWAIVVSIVVAGLLLAGLVTGIIKR